MLDVRSLQSDFRLETDDREVPGGSASVVDEDSLWKNAEIVGFVNEAQREIVRRTWILRDRASLPVTAGEPYVELPENFMEPRGRGQLTNARTAPVLRNFNELFQEQAEDYGIQGVGAWDGATGPPRFMCFDDITGMIRLVPEPVEDDTLELAYYRWPAHVARRTDKLDVVDERYRRAYLHWMKHLAYSKQDADALDLQRSQMFEARFNAEISRLYGEARRSSRRAGTVRYGGL